MPNPSGPLIGGIQFDETLSGTLQGLATVAAVVQNPSGSEPAAVMVTNRAPPNQLQVRGLFASIPNVRTLQGTTLACTLRGVGPVNYFCTQAELVGNPTGALSDDGSSVWVVNAQFTLVPLT